ncbi:MAG: Ig-like domain-containing protein, partial [Acidimicrobiales bacterium]|nr:Ig-like domain-containing protein [Acidimicrobiales bacterium]
MLALTVVPFIAAVPAQASASCEALNTPSADGFYYKGRFLAGLLQAGDVITISAGFPIGTAPKPFVPTAFFLGIGTFDAAPSVPGVNFPGTLVYTVPQDLANVHLNWVTGPSIPDGYTVEVTWQVSCQSAPKANPTLSTQASPATMLGGPVYDTATLSGGNAPTGTITFRLYGPDDANCGGPAAFTTSATVAGNGSYQSAGFTPTATGTYRWTASYSGDARNNAVSSACNAANETVLVKPFEPPPPTSTLSGNVSGPVTVASGQSIVVTDGQVVGPITIQAGGALRLVNTKVTN